MSIRDEIINIKRRIWELEHPYLYKIGDTIEFRGYDENADAIKKNGVVVNRERNYMSDSAEDAYTIYHIYIDSGKRTERVYDHNIIGKVNTK